MASYDRPDPTAPDRAPDQVTTYTYDALGRLISVTEGPRLATWTAYDTDGTPIYPGPPPDEPHIVG